MNDLSIRIREALLQKGASLVGFADLSDMPESVRESLGFGVSMAVALDPSVIARLENGPTREYYIDYRRANALLWELAQYTAGMINGLGYRAIAKEPTKVGIDPETHSTILPHKTVATRAGLGWIGKCALLITEQYGSALRLGTVLTNAQLEVGTPVTYSRCGDCRLCVDSCPTRAPSGRNWNSNLHRDAFFNVFACEEGARGCSIAKLGIDDTICGICILACPWTAKYIESASGT
jgi:epoxyqueuosine reductase